MDPQITLIILIVAASVLIFLAFRLGRILGRGSERREWENFRIEEIVKERIKRSRAVLGGQFSEQLAPFLPDFEYNPNECRFIGKPVDLLVFRGMDQGRIDEIVFIEIKSGKAKNLSKTERLLRDAVNEGRVSWRQYNVPDAITGGTAGS